MVVTRRMIRYLQQQYLLKFLHKCSTTFRVLRCRYIITLPCNYSLLLLFSQDKKKKYEPPVPTRVGKKKKKSKGPDAANKLPQGISISCPSPPIMSRAAIAIIFH